MMQMTKNAQFNADSIVDSVGESSNGLPIGENIIALPEGAPLSLIVGCLYEGGVFKGGPGGAVIYDPTP